MFDGQNVFDDAPSFAGGWHLDRAVERLARVRRPAPIVIAIDHGNERRLSELSFRATSFGPPKLDPLVDWIADQLTAAARRQFSVTEGVSQVLLGGSSMGGLAALYGHMRRPEVFGGALAMSPSLFMANRAIFDEAARLPRPWVSRVYLDAGKREARGHLAKDTERFATLLAEKGWRLGSDLQHRVDPRGSHNEKSWRRRATTALRFVLDRT